MGTVTGVTRIRRVRLLCWLVCLVLMLSRYGLALNEEGRLLLEWKQGLVDEDSVLGDWNPADVTPCTWAGVKCTQGSVSAIDFSFFDTLTGPITSNTFGKFANLTSFDVAYSNLSGNFPTDIVNCSKLVNINISWSWIGGEIPREISNLKLLQHLDLSYACFNGTMSDTIFEGLQELRSLNLHGNYFTGPVPDSIASLKGLQLLTLSLNLWTGKLPPGILKLQNLRVFWFGDDNLDTMPMLDLASWVNMEELRFHSVRFERGPFPAAVEKMPKLEVLQLSWCNLTGPIPAFLKNLKHLRVINLDNNSLSGIIPDIFEGMSNLVDFSLQINNFTGPLPPTLWQCKKLQILFVYKNGFGGDISGIGNFSDLEKADMSQNNFTGPIPAALGALTRLKQLNLSFNNLSGEVPPGLADSVEIFEIRLNNNQLTDEIPYSLGTKSVLRVVDFSTNRLQGLIPPNLCSGNMLNYLNLMNNNLTGGIPETYGSCTNLDVIMLSNNQLEGPVPEGLWGGPKMTKLQLNDNNLNGSIGRCIGHARLLSLLFMENNRFTGPIPEEIGQTILSKFRAYSNNLSGALPEHMGNLSTVTELSLHANAFSGAIPPTIRLCKQLVQLNLSKNDLQGTIPDELADLPNIANMDLSENDLTGPIPKRFFSLVQLQTLNVAFNNLSGVIPKQQNGQAYVFVNFTGNPYLCVEGSCPYTDVNALNSPSDGSSRITGALKVKLACILSAVALLLFVVSCLCVRRYKRKLRDKDTELSEYTEAEDSWILTSFQTKAYHEFEVTELDEDNLLGSGGSGKVYRAKLMNGELVAVKKLWGVKKDDSTSHDHGFRTEVKTLATIRHRHIVKLLCCCTKRDSNLLVYEYMPNGSLGDLLHGTKAATLTWEMRYKIAMGSAMGLQYLHHDCVPQILHRDIKSNNILLDMDYEAHLADFGIAKVVETAVARDLSTIAGSLGYIAPEYAFSTRVDEKSDIYSFGVVLLELVTGKRAVDSAVFGEGSDLVRWVSDKVQTEEGVYEILDPNCGEGSQQDMISFLRVAMMCTSFNPVDRPSMRKVVLLLMQAAPTPRVDKQSLIRKASSDSSLVKSDSEDEQYWNIFV
ncbi:hypothetical protein M758_5G191000 [Ceratodon purpureus]|nr:hypothetical protein M758_5G191000 [Ceratodon purpureus]